MRFMIMHKNDPNTEAGTPPPLELVHKMGAFIGEYAAGGPVHRRRRPGREQDANAPDLPQRANAPRSAVPMAASTSCRRRRCC